MSEELKYHEQQEGWRHEYLYNGKCIVFERPREIGGGFVTVDLERRIYSCGYGWVNQHAGDKTYAGRGWKDQIIRDAIDHLDRIMTEVLSNDR